MHAQQVGLRVTGLLAEVFVDLQNQAGSICHDNALACVLEHVGGQDQFFFVDLQPLAGLLEHLAFTPLLALSAQMRQGRQAQKCQLENCQRQNQCVLVEQAKRGRLHVARRSDGRHMAEHLYGNFQVPHGAHQAIDQHGVQTWRGQHRVHAAAEFRDRREGVGVFRLRGDFGHDGTVFHQFHPAAQDVIAQGERVSVQVAGLLQCQQHGLAQAQKFTVELEHQAGQRIPAVFKTAFDFASLQQGKCHHRRHDQGNKPRCQGQPSQLVAQ